MKKIYYFILTILTTVTAGCNSYLDTKPYGQTIPKTAEEFSALLHNHLNNVDEGTDEVLLGNADMLKMWDVECSDDFEVYLTKAGGRGLKKYVGDVVSTALSFGTYKTLYEVVRDCNLVLNEMQEKNTALSKKVRATAHAMRGVAYYQLLRIFTEAPIQGSFANQLGVPLVQTFDMEDKPLRSTMKETIEFIEKDFNASLSYELEEDVYRFTKDVVKGYLTRLYFWTEQWDKALPLAQELLVKYPLITDEGYTNMMNTMYDKTGNQLVKAYRSVSIGGNEKLSSISAAIMNRPISKRFIDCFDDSEKSLDIRYSLWTNDKRQTIKKFFCGLRSAELKLIEAECYCHIGQEAQALEAINALREKRIKEVVPYTMANLPSPLQSEIIKVDAKGQPLSPLMSLILRERRKELFMEGDRFFELKRNGTPEFWVASNGHKYTTEKFMYTFPLPISNIQIVAGLIQNPGYTEITN